jgi:hypothetical protein
MGRLYNPALMPLWFAACVDMGKIVTGDASPSEGKGGPLETEGSGFPALNIKLDVLPAVVIDALVRNAVLQPAI